MGLGGRGVFGFRLGEGGMWVQVGGGVVEAGVFSWG